MDSPFKNYDILPYMFQPEFTDDAENHSGKNDARQKAELTFLLSMIG